MLAHSNSLDVQIWRGSGTQGKLEKFSVPRHDNQTVLDVVAWIQQHSDPTVSYRYACRVGMCGSCAMTVNGVPRWTCRTHVAKATKDNTITITPLRNLPVIKDLAVDMDPFFDKWIKAGGVHAASRNRNESIEAVVPSSPARIEIDEAIECINCSVCYAACDTVSNNADFLGPAALQRAWTAFLDPKHANPDAILEAVSGAGGCHNCHSQGSCTVHCPNDLNPMKSIAGLKRATMSASLKKVF